VTDLDWSTDVDPEQLVRHISAANLTSNWPVPRRSPRLAVAKWSEKEFVQIGIEALKASLSQFMHGEQGAMMVAAKIVETVPWIDAGTTRPPRRWTKPATPRSSPSTCTPSWARPNR